jgi:hypothetical protein
VIADSSKPRLFQRKNTVFLDMVDSILVLVENTLYPVRYMPRLQARQYPVAMQAVHHKPCITLRPD